MRKLFFSIMLTLGLVSVLNASSDVEEFKAIANSAIKAVVEDTVDADKMMKDMDKLIVLGKKFCKKNATGKGTKFMNLVIDNAEKMKAMTLDEIEEAWHDGEAITNAGINLDDFDHFSPVFSSADTVIHPATSYIVLKNYKKDGDKDGLAQIKDELSEVLEHASHLED